MIEIVQKPNEYCFVGNPVHFKLKADTGLSIPYSVSCKNEKVELRANFYYSKDGYYADADISEVLKSFFDDGLGMYGETVSIAEYPELIRECVVEIDGKKFTIYALDGGVSNEILADLSKYGLDMFSFRLNNPERGILFTTRTQSAEISLRESELFPFVFLHPGKPIFFLSDSGMSIQESARVKGTPCLMDIGYVRQLFQNIYNELPTCITIQVDGADSTIINIKPSQLSESSHKLVFKNSLGAYECIEVTGRGNYTPTFSEDKSYQQYTSLGTFQHRRNRLEIQSEITIQTGYKNQDEFNFLMDMLATDRCYLVYSDGRVAECIPSAESIKVPLRITEPTSLEVKLKMINVNKYHSTDLDLATPGAWVWDGIWNDFGTWFDGKQILDFKE